MPISKQDAQKISMALSQMYPPGYPTTVGGMMGSGDGELIYYTTPTIDGNQVLVLGALISQLSSCYVKILTDQGKVAITFSTSATFHF
jgi:hypothetical protein